jgi:hypothetical protein
MTFLKHWLLPPLAWTLVMFSSQTAVAQQARRVGAATAAAESDSAEVQAYRLTIEDVRKLYAANLALIRLQRSHPELAQAEQDTTDLPEYAVTVLARRLEDRPLTREAVRAAGLTSRHFFVITLALAYAGLSQQTAVLCGRNAQCVAAAARAAEASHLTANVAFINQHQAELQRLQGEFVRDSSVARTKVP